MVDAATPVRSLKRSAEKIVRNTKRNVLRSLDTNLQDAEPLRVIQVSDQLDDLALGHKLDAFEPGGRARACPGSDVIAVHVDVDRSRPDVPLVQRCDEARWSITSRQ